MLNPKIQDAINEQIKNELYSSYLYLSMASYFESVTLPGFAHWMHVQSEEEREHAMKFYEYVHDRGGRVLLQAIPEPPISWNTTLELFQEVLEHEKQVTAMINNLYKVALEEHDYASQVMLQWFITEQVEEEKNASEIIEHLKMIDEHRTAILQLDHHVGKRGGDD